MSRLRKKGKFSQGARRQSERLLTLAAQRSKIGEKMEMSERDNLQEGEIRHRKLILYGRLP